MYACTHTRVGHNGREMFTYISKFNEDGKKFHNLHCKFLTVDSTNNSRKVLEQMMESWRKEYVNILFKYTDLSKEEINLYFYDIIDNGIKNPNGFFSWTVTITAVQKK